MRKATLLAFVAMALSSPLSAAEPLYYADIMIDVSETGAVTISGVTNHPALSDSPTNAYTSKKGQYWLLNITTYDSFSDYVYTVRMPEGSVINYIKSDDRIGIREEGSRIMIEGYGSGDPFSVLVQYSINPPDYTAYAMAAVAVAAALTAFLLLRKRIPRRMGRPYDPAALTERQLSIVRFMEKAGKPVSQHDLEKGLGLPKSSLSRNVRTLERMGIIRKTSRGMSNVLEFVRE